MNGKAAVVSVAALALLMAVLVVSQTPHAVVTSSTGEKNTRPRTVNTTPLDDLGTTESAESCSGPIVDSAPPPLRAMKPGEWGVGCNNALLAGPFSLKNAPNFNVSQSDFRRITEVIDELKRGKVTTLVLTPRDPVLDSSAFLAHYLRTFGDAEYISRSHYRFERIIDRLYSAREVLDDGRLDWDIWRAYLLFENYAAGRDDPNTYISVRDGWTSINRLLSAKDLLWEYLGKNAQSIRNEKDRFHWWLDALTTDWRATGGRPMRRWFLLQLVVSADTKTVELLDDPAPSDYGLFSFIDPDPFNPFIVLEQIPFGDDEIEEQPAFLRAIEQIAASQKLSFEIWGIDPAKMPPAKVVDTDLAPRITQFAPARVLSQESWSVTAETRSRRPNAYGVYFSRQIGQKSFPFYVRIPPDEKDGVFFFTFNARMYVWPKSKMDTAVIQMLHVSGLIDEATHARFREIGFDSLPITAASNRR